jgi:AcrR family transcriptional regulator
MRTHGWSGATPADDDEAIARILNAARRRIDRSGKDFGISDVAKDVGVTRQTVYRYFSSTEALLFATSVAEVGPFLDTLAVHVRKIHDPAEAVVEGIAHTLERLPHERYLGLLLTPGKASAFSAGVTSDMALSFGRSIVERFEVDWARAGFVGDDLDQLVEFMLRMFQSLVIDPGRPPHQGKELRAFLRRWVAPAISISAPWPAPAQATTQPAKRIQQSRPSRRARVAT